MIEKEIYYNEEKDLYYCLMPDLEYYEINPSSPADVGVLYVLENNSNTNTHLYYSDEKFDVLETCSVDRDFFDDRSARDMICLADISEDYQIDDAFSLEFVGKFIGPEDMFYVADVHHEATHNTQEFMDRIKYRVTFDMVITRVESDMYNRMEQKLAMQHDEER